MESPERMLLEMHQLPAGLAPGPESKSATGDSPVVTH